MTLPAHFILVAVGTAGDTLPLVELARQLVLRGHRVDFLAYEAFATQVRASGAEFHRVGDVGVYERLANDATVWYWHSGFRSLWQYLATAMPDTVGLCMQLQQPDSVLVASSGAVGARLFAEKSGLPLLTLHMSPFYFFSCHANVLGGLGPWPAWAPQWARRLLMRWIDRFFIDAACRDDVNQLRNTMGLAPVRQVFTRWIHSPHRVICAVPGWFAPAQPDWPTQAVTVAFPMSVANPSWVPDDRLKAFLDNPRRPIVFAAGTGAGAALTFFSRAVEVARLTGHRVILVTRWSTQIPQPLPDNVCHIAHAPFDQLLPGAAAIVHNGGIGTMALAMQAGIAQVVVPFAYDQFYNGWRLAALHGGIVVRRQRTAAELAMALSSLLTDVAVQAGCRRNQSLMQHAGRGVEEIIGQVEALVLIRRKL